MLRYCSSILLEVLRMHEKSLKPRFKQGTSWMWAADITVKLNMLKPFNKNTISVTSRMFLEPVKLQGGSYYLFCVHQFLANHGFASHGFQVSMVFHLYPCFWTVLFGSMYPQFCVRKKYQCLQHLRDPQLLGQSCNGIWSQFCNFHITIAIHHLWHFVCYISFLFYTCYMQHFCV
jgi:hypothetical protein